MEINGGASTPDLRGAVWAKQWDGSSSNNAEIEVPNNIGENLGSDFNVSIAIPAASPYKIFRRLSVQ